LTLLDATEASLRQVVGQRSVDDVLTANKEAAQVATLIMLQDILDSYETGIEILEVRLQNVRPPDEVREDFDDVVRARVDKESVINSALAYQQDQLPKARGNAEKVTNAAQAYKEERILKATGEANYFNSLLEEYTKSKSVTRQRLYLEAMEEILPGVKKYVLDPENQGSLLQFLPLNESSSTGS
jgi:membrane protease subunit HflK